jgi:polyisoprenoid-binding protein YceI
MSVEEYRPPADLGHLAYEARERYHRGTSWEIDPAHSEITFSIRHMMISTVRGQFRRFRGHIHFDEATPTDALVDVEIETASIDTRDEQRDAHLRSAEFFDAERFPTITFLSRRVEAVSHNRFRAIGDLTMHGVTREVALDTCFEGVGKDPWGGTRAAFTATTTIDREDYGLTWNAALETGGVLVGKDVKIALDVQVVKKA